MLNDGDHRDVRLRWTRIISPNVLPVTTPGVFRPVKMHSVFEIDIIVRREALNTMLSIGVPLTLLKLCISTVVVRQSLAHGEVV